MKRTYAIVGLLPLGLSQTAESAANSSDNQKTQESRGTTVEDLGRGLKSAVENVEKEIPKIGPAIGETFKKITEKNSGNKPAQETPKEKK
jgi:hypothetical protein